MSDHIRTRARLPMHADGLLENSMKSKTKNEAESKLHRVKDKTEKPLQERMKDPTLEDKDENHVEVGRIPERVASVD